MISSASEFCSLRESVDPEEYHRAAHDEAPNEVWMDVIAKRPDMRFWVAQNKTVPNEIVEIFSPTAIRDLADSVAYIARHDADAVSRVGD